MKKLILLSVLFAITMATSAQTKPIQLYRCYNIGYADANLSTGKLGEWVFKPTNSIIRINVEKQEVIIPAEKDYTIYVVRQVSTKKELDADGDEFTYTVFDAVDQEGNDCRFTQRTYLKFTNANFGLIYPEGVISFYCNIINNE